MSIGWVVINRSVLDSPMWGNERFTKGQAWIDLILNANHKDTKVMLKNTMIPVKRGGQLRSKLTLSKVWRWNRRTVDVYLNMLEKEGMITQQSTQQTTLISICNYNKYQNKSDIDTQQPAQHSTQQPAQQGSNNLHTDNNENNENNENKDQENLGSQKKPPKNKFKLPENIDQKLWSEWLKVRTAKKAVNTPTALNALLKQLSSCAENGITESEAMIVAIENSWKTVRPDWVNNLKNNNSCNANPQQQQEYKFNPSEGFLINNPESNEKVIDAEFTRLQV